MSRRHYATTLEQNTRHYAGRRSALAAAQLRPAGDEKTNVAAPAMTEYVVTKTPHLYYSSVHIDAS